jgi:glutamate/tyrosine decarboxylase-like PLP-dependent enzyme
VPFDSGFAFVNQPQAHMGALSMRFSYITYDADVRDQSDWNPEFSRRARGFAVYAALRELGRDGLAALVERTCGHAHALTTRIGGLPGAELVATSGFNQGLVRFLASAPGATDLDHDRRTDDVIAAINASGEAMFGGVTWRGRRAMRISVSNWRTTANDVERAVAAARRAMAQHETG